MKKKILVSGSIAYDYIMNFPGVFSDHIIADKIHDLNVSFTINRLEKMLGGTGANIAYSLGLLGLKPVLLGVVGQGFADYDKNLKKQGVVTEFVKQDEQEAMAGAYIMTDKKDNQITGFFPGPQDDDYPEIVEKIEDIELAIVSPEALNRMLGLIKKYQDKNIPYIFDPGQQVISFQKNDMLLAVKGARALVCNDYEFAIVKKTSGSSKDELLQTVDIVVITKGEQGAEIYERGKRFDIPVAKPATVLDPTGAGDAFRAGLIFGFLNNWSMEKTGRLAALVAAYTVEKYGTQTHSFTWDDLRKRYEENFGDSLYL